MAPSDPWAVAASEGAWSPWGHGGRDKNWQGTWALVFGILGFAGPPAVAGLLFLLASADAAPSALVGIFGGLLLLYGTPVAVVGFGFAALILGLIGRGSARRGRATNGGVATGGAVLGGLLILLAFAGAILIGVGLNQFLSFVSQGF